MLRIDNRTEDRAEDLTDPVVYKKISYFSNDLYLV